VNLTGAFLTAQAAARAMIAAGRGGHIVFMSSWTQDHPRAGIGGYCASKGGMKMLAKCLALELAPREIRVNLVAPGWVEAGLTAQNLERNPGLAPEIANQIPLGRLLPAEELAALVRLLCAEEAAYLTGTTLLADGGSSLCYRKPPSAQ
jgi:glucose 1-dehydrogenase